MFDLIGLFKLFMSLWPFVKEHLFQNRKIMKHFHYSKSEFAVLIVHLVLMVMIFNTVNGIMAVMATQRELEIQLEDQRRKATGLENELIERDRKVETLEHRVAALNEEVLFLRDITRKNNPHESQ